MRKSAGWSEIASSGRARARWTARRRSVRTASVERAKNSPELPSWYSRVYLRFFFLKKRRCQMGACYPYIAGCLSARTVFSQDLTMA